ncbi:tetratricopeptide (TPR) repeat protein [Micromonospora sp. HB375]|uniref:tetratricopeptide repeat protein n=1 Tax=unclassified Micromonospora TaxID=2617518 RepID=UPI001AE82A02|nr:MULTISPECIES: tetratricopeptide repeat protein [unclassified Micromonospora]MBP1781882.1 tetratricopeptide (TPR) repeat protein [Micromonospora sp. HB375]MDH6471240.1 tetratricopeptide (TPR) repeat protein [Micromonospora sp. H404/HB375]
MLALLSAGRALVPYSVLHDPLLRRILRWADGQGDVVERVLYVDGPAGVGKTRLLVEAAGRSAARWGWARRGCGAEAVAAAAGLGGSVVLVLDDAETRDDVTAAVTAWATLAASEVRLVVASRVDAVWWPVIRRGLSSDVVSELPFRAQVTVPPIVGDEKAQRQMFAQALRHFTPKGEPVPTAVWVPVLPPPSIALLHAGAAWAAVTAASGQVDAAATVAGVFAVEQKRWLATARGAGVNALPQEVFGQAVALAALVGAPDAATARQMLARLPGLVRAGEPDREAGRLAEWLRGLYRQQEPDWLAPRLPAVLLERYVTDLLIGTPTMAAVLSGATSGDQSRARRVLTLLSRASAHTSAALPAVAMLLRHDPVPMLTAAIRVASQMQTPFDALIAGYLAADSTHALTAAQIQQLYDLIPAPMKQHVLAATTRCFLRLYLDHPDVDTNDLHTLQVRHTLASALHSQGRYAEAEIEYREVLAIQTRVLGAEHPDTLRTRYGLANVLDSQGRYAEAEIEYCEVLVASSRVLGAEHPDTLRLRHGLANVLDSQGRYAEAEIEYREVLAAFTRVLGAEHPDTLRPHLGFATVLHRQGRYAEAEIEYREVLAIQTRVLGAEHPDTLRTRYGLANVLDGQGRYAEAEIEYREVLAAFTRVLGAEHPDTLRLRHGLANVLDSQGRYAEAEIEYREVLVALTRVLGAEHPDTPGPRHGLANVLDGQGRHAEAEIEYREVLAIQTRVLGAEHPHALGARYGLANVLDSQGRYAEAEIEYREVLAAFTRVLGAEHPDTLGTRYGLANVLDGQGRHAEAEIEYREVLAVQTRVLGAEHPDTLRTRARQRLNSQGRYSEAEAEYREV